jgi:hypothetical protein
MQFPSLLKTKTQPMDKEQSSMFMRLMLAEMQGSIEEFGDKQAHEFGFPGQVLKKRLDLGPIKISTALALWLVLLSEGNPGSIVMWAWTMRELFVQHNHRMLTVNDWTMAFPMGVPTEEERSRIWDLQKQDGAPAGNGLDRGHIWTVNTDHAQSVQQPGDSNG